MGFELLELPYLASLSPALKQIRGKIGIDSRALAFNVSSVTLWESTKTSDMDNYRITYL